MSGGAAGQSAAEAEAAAGAAKAASRRYPDRPAVGVLAVVIRDGRALLVERAHPPNAGKWGFPGGVLELGETVAAGAMRELREETGIIAEPAGILTVVDTIDRDEAGRIRHHYVLVAVLGRWCEGEGVPADDAAAIAWVTRDDIARGALAALPRVLPLFDLALARGAPEPGLSG